MTLNGGLIPATGGAQGASYRFLDEAPGAGAFYWLEAVESDGSAERFGPITVDRPTAVTIGTLGAQSVPLAPWLALGMVALAAGLLAARRLRR